MTFLFNQPYPFTYYKESRRRNILFSVFVTLFLLLYRPFGLNVYSYERSYIILGYGIIIFFTLSLNDFIAYLFFKNIFCEKNWKIKSQLIWIFIQLFSIGITCFFYAILIDAFPKNIISFLKIELYVLMTSIIPIVMVVILKQNYLLKQNSKNASLLNTKLGLINNKETKNNIENNIIFIGDNQNEYLQINRDQLCYITSQDNYFEVVWFDGEKLLKKLMRGSLSKVEDTTKSFSFLFRCHRAYIVNLNNIIKIEGNAQGYRLHLKHTSEIVPVSRSKGIEFHKALHSNQ